MLVAPHHALRRQPPFALLAACVLCAPASLGCTFDLADVRVDTEPNASNDAALDVTAAVEPDVVWASDSIAPDADADSHADAGTDADAGAVDGCWPSPDHTLCALAGLACGKLETVDNCGQSRVIDACGACDSTAHCDAGSCVPYAYAWKSSAWSACSALCDGGTQSRDVWCERDDGVHVVDGMCAGAKPEASQACNQDPCCSPFCVSHDACGSNGCGGDCGTCVSDRFCRNGYCVWDHGNNGSETCSTICAWGSSTCVDTSSADCSTKADTTCYCW